MEGEDLIIAELTKNLEKGFYVDAGCYHPLHLSNTYLLYKKKWNGINIDMPYVEDVPVSKGNEINMDDDGEDSFSESNENDEGFTVNQ